MAHSIKVLGSLAVLALASVTLTPPAEAQGRQGGGGRAQAGGGGGGGQRAQASGGGGQRAQVNNTNQDARSTQVRNTSVNNVNNNRTTNVNRNTNVNVNVNNNNHGGWDNDYHPVATAAAVAGTVAVIGAIVNTPPAGCVPVNYGGIVYQQCGATWYVPQGAQYAVVAPPY